jgi:hypothetical protein
MLRSKILCLVAFAAVLTPAAFALNNRSAVSVNGVDTNPCTVALPCRSFTTAIPATVPGGEVVALSTAGYGPFTVSNSMTISGAPGVHAAITVTSGDGIAVTAASSDVVTLRNLVLIGAGGSQGIDDSFAAGELHVIGCLVRGFGTGIVAVTNVATIVSIEDSVVLDNNGGIYMAGDSLGASIVRCTVTNSTIIGNSNGLQLTYGTSSVVTGSTIAYNNAVGVWVDASAGTGALVSRAVLESNTIAHNGNGVAVSASGGNNSARVTLSQNVVAFSVIAGVNQSGAGVAASFNNNRFVGNATDGGPFAPATMK